MLLTSPAYIFAFLPASLAVYFFVPDKRKKTALLFFCVMYYFLVSFENPHSVVVMFFIVLLTFFATRIMTRLKGRTGIAFSHGIILFVTLTVIFMRVMTRQFSDVYSIGYPFGTAIWSLSVISCIIDVYRKDAEPPKFIDCAVYILFYPVMIAGPILRYKDSVRAFSEINFCTENFAEGIQLFMTGYIKRIAIGAVLYDAYCNIVKDGVNTEGNRAVTLYVAVILVILITVVIYSVFSGYSDMATGISLMYGIRLDNNFGNPITSYTPVVYINRFMISLRTYTNDYIVGTFLRNRDKRSLRGFIAASVAFLSSVMWFRTDWRLFIISLPLAFLIGWEYSKGFSEFFAKRKITKIIGCIITFIVMSCFWMTVRLKNPFGIFGYKLLLFSPMRNSENLSMFGNVSDLKYLFVIGVLVAVYVITTLRRKYIGKRDLMPEHVNYIFSISLLLLFVFTLVFFMPQFPQYAYSALGGILS